MNILTNISGHMGVAATREEVETPRIMDTRKSTQRRVIWTGVIMYARNDGVGLYQSQQQIIIEIFY